MAADFKKIADLPVCWLSGASNGIVVASSIGLVRNAAKIPFPVSGKRDVLEKLKLHFLEISGKLPVPGGLQLLETAGLSESCLALLSEHFLMGDKQFASSKESLFLYSRDGAFSVFLNGDDHFLFRILAPGMNLKQSSRLLFNCESVTAEEIPFAFDRKLGYLSSSLSDIGTGMRAELILHLPGLVLADQAAPVMQGMSKMGISVSGIAGPEAEGSFFRIANQGTLGESEEEILDRLSELAGQICEHEKNARIKLMREQENAMYDRIGRAYGILRHGYSISLRESLELLSLVRLGAGLNMFSSVDVSVTDYLILKTRQAHLAFASEKTLSEPESDAFRSSVIREVLKNRRSGKS